MVTFNGKLMRPSFCIDTQSRSELILSTSWNNDSKLFLNFHLFWVTSKYKSLIFCMAEYIINIKIIVFWVTIKYKSLIFCMAEYIINIKNIVFWLTIKYKSLIFCMAEYIINIKITVYWVAIWNNSSSFFLNIKLINLMFKIRLTFISIRNENIKKTKDFS